MHRRSEDRCFTDFEIVMTDLNDESLSGAGQVCDISKSGICTLLSVDMAPGSMVRLEIADSTLFGHVAYCNPESGQFRIGVEVVRVLLGGTDLSRLLESTLEELPDVAGLEWAGLARSARPEE